ncbi:MAG: hypothetical protein FWE03_05075 [Firmicutes bacterium]|nr:hypothetical protein [Bacillota bacterium]
MGFFSKNKKEPKQKLSFTEQLRIEEERQRALKMQEFLSKPVAWDNNPKPVDDWTRQIMQKKPFISRVVAEMFAYKFIDLKADDRVVLLEYILQLDKDIKREVATLLGQMIPEVPLKNLEDIVECGFMSEIVFTGDTESKMNILTGQHHDSEDIMRLRALCGAKQSGWDVAKMKNADGSVKSFVDIKQVLMSGQ